MLATTVHTELSILVEPDGQQYEYLVHYYPAYPHSMALEKILCYQVLSVAFSLAEAATQITRGSSRLSISKAPLLLSPVELSFEEEYNLTTALPVFGI